MTLLIACLLIYIAHLPLSWYGIAVVIWMVHLGVHLGKPYGGKKEGE